MSIKLHVNGQPGEVGASADTPLLYALRNDLGLTGPRFGCGLAQCGACTVHVDGAPARSCVTPVGAVAGREIITLDGLAATHPGAAEGRLHPVQQAFIDEQAAQCGYCINGWIMTAAAILKRNPSPTEAEWREGLAGLKCRCGAHMNILRALKRVSANSVKG